jgi:hypothetical protein
VSIWDIPFALDGEQQAGGARTRALTMRYPVAQGNRYGEGRPRHRISQLTLLN